MVYSSVFRPRPEQRHVCNLATTHRGKVMASEWALLDTLEVQLYNEERDKVEKVRAVKAAEQRSFLEGQLLEKRRAEQEEKLQEMKEGELLMRDVEAHKLREQAMAAVVRAHHVKVKNERVSMLEATRHAKEQARQQKVQEEAQTLVQIQQQLELEAQRAAAKVQTLKENAVRTREENEVKIRAKKEAEKIQRLMDTEAMKESLLLLEKQDGQGREEAKAFHDMIQARAGKVGQKAVEESRERLDRENRLMKEREEKQEREVQERAERERVKRERAKEEMIRAREEHLRLKEDRALQAKAEAQRLRETAEASLRAEREAEDRKMAGVRAAKVAQAVYLCGQMAEREERSVDEGVGMTEEERRLNRQLIDHATKIVGRPRPLSMRFL